MILSGTDLLSRSLPVHDCNDDVDFDDDDVDEIVNADYRGSFQSNPEAPAHQDLGQLLEVAQLLLVEKVKRHP